MTAKIMETGGGAVMEKNSGNHHVEEIFAKLKEVKNPKEKRKLLNELWAEIKPEVSRAVSRFCAKYKNLLDRYRPGTKTEDLESEAYEKLRKDYDKFIKADNFYNYFITAIRNNFFNNYVRRGIRDKENKSNFTEDFLQSEHSQNGDKTEDRVAINEVKDHLIGWARSGALTPTETIILILRYGLGKKLVKEFVNEFKDKPEKFRNKSILGILQNINFDHVDFDAGMTFEETANTVGFPGKSDVLKAERRAVAKIKNELKI